MKFAIWGAVGCHLGAPRRHQIASRQARSRRQIQFRQDNVPELDLWSQKITNINQMGLSESPESQHRNSLSPRPCTLAQTRSNKKKKRKKGSHEPHRKVSRSCCISCRISPASHPTLTALSWKPCSRASPQESWSPFPSLGFSCIVRTQGKSTRI